MKPLLEIVHPGTGMTLQDAGRLGYRAQGVPPSGPMDLHAFTLANLLVSNTPPTLPTLEILLHGAQIRFLQPTLVAVTGAANLAPPYPTWTSFIATPDHPLSFLPSPAGNWSYLAIAGGFDGPQWMNSRSHYPKGLMGHPYPAGAQLQGLASQRLDLGTRIASRSASPGEIRDYRNPPSFEIWPGPQHSLFTPEAREHFAATPWQMTSQSDRSGYRLQGPATTPPSHNLISEPVRVGSIQIPSNGTPIITMPDGPTLGGYHKIAWLSAEARSWISQMRPGQPLQFYWTATPSPL